jgi:hypothetical protein
MSVRNVVRSQLIGGIPFNAMHGRVQAFSRSLVFRPAAGRKWLGLYGRDKTLIARHLHQYDDHEKISLAFDTENGSKHTRPILQQTIAAVERVTNIQSTAQQAKARTQNLDPKS